MRLLSQARDLSRRKARERDGRFVAEGVRAVEELLRSPIGIDGVLCGPQLIDSPRGARLRADLDASGVMLVDVTEREFASAASTESPQGVLAIGTVPVRTLGDLAERTPLRLLVIDAIQDPGNLGTLLRTAHALGLDGSVALPGTVDLWNAKVVRSAMGSLFRHHALQSDLEALTAFLERENCPLWGADTGGVPVGDLHAPPRLALAVGNEGAGLAPAIRQIAKALVSLPMRGDAESLNVAVAAGILLYQVQP